MNPGRAISKRHQVNEGSSTLPSLRLAQSAFTLVEIVITLTLMALLLGATVPSFRGIIREQQALEPLTELASLARTARDRAVRLQRPYLVGLDAQGCYAAPFLPHYGTSQTYQDLKNEVDAYRLESAFLQSSAARFGLDNESVPNAPHSPAEADDRDFLLRYDWPPGYRVSLRFWQESAWETLDGPRTRHWIFQPTGLSPPLLVRLESEGVSAEAQFDPLTAEITSLRSSVR